MMPSGRAAAKGFTRLASRMAGAWALVAILMLPAAESAAQGKRVRPPEEQPEQYPDGPNREDTFYFCTACHSFKLVAAQGMSRERWDESLTWMVDRHKMPDVRGEDRKKILDYLATAFPERAQPGGWKNPFTGR
jgi:hypothetical protein